MVAPWYGGPGWRLAAAFANQRNGEDGTMSILDRHLPFSGYSALALCTSGTWTGSRSQMERRSPWCGRVAVIPRWSAASNSLKSRQYGTLVIVRLRYDKMCIAKAGGALGDQVKYWLPVTRRIGDYAETSLVAVCCSSASSRSRVSSATFFSECQQRQNRATASLAHYPALAVPPSASRFNWFAACTGAPSHWLPLGSGRGNLAHWRWPGYE